MDGTPPGFIDLTQGGPSRPKMIVVPHGLRSLYGSRGDPGPRARGKILAGVLRSDQGVQVEDGEWGRPQAVPKRPLSPLVAKRSR